MPRKPCTGVGGLLWAGLVYANGAIATARCNSVGGLALVAHPPIAHALARHVTGAGVVSGGAFHRAPLARAKVSPSRGSDWSVRNRLIRALGDREGHERPLSSGPARDTINRFA
jgi:hypothetical protein